MPFPALAAVVVGAAVVVLFPVAEHHAARRITIKETKMICFKNAILFS